MATLARYCCSSFSSLWLPWVPEELLLSLLWPSFLPAWGDLVPPKIPGPQSHENLCGTPAPRCGGRGPWSRGGAGFSLFSSLLRSLPQPPAWPPPHPQPRRVQLRPPARYISPLRCSQAASPLPRGDGGEGRIYLPGPHGGGGGETPGRGLRGRATSPSIASSPRTRARLVGCRRQT